MTTVPTSTKRVCRCGSGRPPLTRNGPTCLACDPNTQEHWSAYRALAAKHAQKAEEHEGQQ